MLKKMMCLPLALLMSNAYTMYKYAPIIKVIVGEATYEKTPIGGINVLHPIVTYHVPDDTTVWALKDFVAGCNCGYSRREALYANLNFDTTKPCNVRELGDNESLEAVAREVALVSIYPTIYKTN